MSAVENIKIDRNIPMPDRLSAYRKGKWSDLSRKMKIGDSVVVTMRQAQCLYQAIRKLEHLSCMRKIKSDQYRVWKGAKK